MFAELIKVVPKYLEGIYTFHNRLRPFVNRLDQGL